MDGKMKSKSLIIGLVFSQFLVLNPAFSASKSNDFFEYFRNGNYTKAINAIDTSRDNKNGDKNYYKGLCYSKLQEYDNAILEFEKAIKAKNKNNDLYYEYGQALYASNRLRDSRQAFESSFNQKFNSSASLYYVAHISQLIEDFDKAETSYLSLISGENFDDKIKQISKFQLAETKLARLREKNLTKEEQSNFIDLEILPLLNQALEIDKNSNVARDINARSADLMREFDLDPDLLSNGKRLSPKRISGYVTQRIKFDDNITMTNEENNITQSKEESYIFETEAYIKRDFKLNKKIVSSPEVRANFNQYSNQDAPSVYQNDSFLATFNLKNRLEHTVKNSPATFNFDVDFSKTLKDADKIHKRKSYATSTTFGLGEKFTYFIFGDTGVKIKRKLYRGKSETISNNTLAISLDQSIALGTKDLLIVLIEADYIDNYNSKTTNTNTYLTRFDYIIPEILPRYTLGLALSTTITDTLEQKITRGTEFTLNPSIDFSKDVTENFKVSINYDYSKNNSKNPDYAYQKHIFSSEFRISF
jgi:tetratricopeptide (TPR) repeat protein